MSMLDDTESGEGRRRRRRRKTKKKPTPIRRVARPGADPAATLYLGENVRWAAREAARPNRAYGCTGATPATPIAAGASVTCTTTFQLDCFVQHMSFPATLAGTFLCSSLKIGGYELVASGPINLESLAAAVNEYCRPTPVTGRKFSGGVSVTATLINITAAPESCPGITFWVQEEACNAPGTKTQIAPGVFQFGYFRRVLNAAKSGAKKAGMSLNSLLR